MNSIFLWAIAPVGTHHVCANLSRVFATELKKINGQNFRYINDKIALASLLHSAEFCIHFYVQIPNSIHVNHLSY